MVKVVFVLTQSNVIGLLRTLQCPTLPVPSSQDFDNSTTSKMCFGDQDTYTTRTYVRNGARYSEESSQPRYGVSWRRRNGLGGSYYPSKYYRRRPSGRYMSSALTQNRYSSQRGHPQHYGYGQQGYGQYNGYSRSVVPGGYRGYSSGYGRYYPDNRVAMPYHAAIVSLRSFPLSPILPSRITSCSPLPPPHWLVWHLNSSPEF
jgi:hypothetical protein